MADPSAPTGLTLFDFFNMAVGCFEKESERNRLDGAMDAEGFS